MRKLNREQMLVAIAKAETDGYLRMAEEHAADGDKEMCSTILEWAARAISNKAKLAAPRKN